MTDRPGHLWTVIQDWLDTFRWRPPSQRELAPRFGVSSSSLTEYKYARTMPPPAFLVRVAEEIHVPYEVVLNAMLEDHGYRGESLQRVREELMGNAEHPAATNEADTGRHLAVAGTGATPAEAKEASKQAAASKAKQLAAVEEMERKKRDKK